MILTCSGLVVVVVESQRIMYKKSIHICLNLFNILQFARLNSTPHIPHTQPSPAQAKSRVHGGGASRVRRPSETATRLKS